MTSIFSPPFLFYQNRRTPCRPADIHFREYPGSFLK
nr:MAG TPA: hypothetical protein [Bacteriophage sp.]